MNNSWYSPSIRSFWSEFPSNVISGYFSIMHISGHEKHEPPSSISAFSLMEVVSCPVDALRMTAGQCLHKVFQHPVCACAHSVVPDAL